MYKTCPSKPKWEISYNFVFLTYQLAQGIKRYEHFRLANTHRRFIINVKIFQTYFTKIYFMEASFARNAPNFEKGSLLEMQIQTTFVILSSRTQGLLLILTYPLEADYTQIMLTRLVRTGTFCTPRIMQCLEKIRKWCLLHLGEALPLVDALYPQDSS